MADASHSLFDFGVMADTYDQWYETDLGKEQDREQQAAVAKLLPQAAPGDLLLEVGCGTGHWSRFFARRGYEVFGLDISAEMIEVARSRRIPNCHFEIGDACHLPTGNPSYRVVAAMFTVEFVSDPVLAVAGMSGCAVDRGRVLIGTLNRLAALNRVHVAGGDEPYASAHLLSPSELRALLRPYAYGRIRMATTGEELKRPMLRPLKAFWDGLRLRCDRAPAPFIAAAVRT